MKEYIIIILLVVSVFYMGAITHEYDMVNAGDKGEIVHTYINGDINITRIKK